MQNEDPVSPTSENCLASAMPDPSGPPQPVEADDPVLREIAQVGVVLVALGGLMLPMFASVGQTRGATRSVKLQWEHRQQQIEQAIQDDQAYRSQTAKQGADEGTPE